MYLKESSYVSYLLFHEILHIDLLSTPSIKLLMSKRQKVLNLLSKGESVTWKTLRNRFDLGSPRALVDTLRSEGNMIYVNKTAKGTSYRMGVPTKAIIAAGIKKLYGTPYAYKNA